jgi:uncharacterized protein
MIGSSVCDALLARGDEVVGLTRNPERARSTNPTVIWHPWNSTLERPPADALVGVDGVINVIGESINQRWTEDAKRRIRASRIQATHNLVQAISTAERRPRALVSQSAVGYYGDRGDAVVDEDTPAGSSFDAEVCADWEAAACEAENAGLRVALTRSAPVLDKRGGLLKQMLLPFKLGIGGPIAGGNQYLPWIHTDDEVRILLWALDDERVSGAINSTAPEPVTNREFARSLGRVLSRPAVVPVPKLALAVLFGGELAEVVSGGQRAIPRRALDLGFEFRYPALEPALRAALG